MPSVDARFYALKDWLKEGYPDKGKEENSAGSVWMYRGPRSILEAYLPDTSGVLWGDNMFVSRTSLKPVEEAEGKFASGDDLMELTVETSKKDTPSDSIGTTKEIESYSLEWVEVDLPLELHRQFSTGGSYALTATDFQHIEGWKAETDHSYKSAFKYVLKDTNNDPKNGNLTPITITGNALVFVKLLQRGFDAYPEFLPLWTKKSVWKSYKAPPQGNIGLKESPEGIGYPSGWEWRKCNDRSDQIGNSTRWDQNESWQGASKVWIDKDNLYIT